MRDDLGAAPAERVVAARVVEMPMRVEQHADGRAAEPLRDDQRELGAVVRGAAVDHEPRGAVIEQQHVAREALELVQAVAQGSDVERLRRELLRRGRARETRDARGRDRGGGAESQAQKITAIA